MAHSRPFQRESYRNPNGPSVRTDTGSGFGSGNGQVRERPKRDELHAWVQTNLPDQHFGFAYHSAYLCWVENGRRLPTKAAVLAKLKERGKEIGQLRKAGLA